MSTSQERVEQALRIAARNGATDDVHHKMWVIDQMVRALTGCPTVQDEAVDYKGIRYTFTRQGDSEEYQEWVRMVRDGEEGPETYEWDTGVAR